MVVGGGGGGGGGVPAGALFWGPECFPCSKCGSLVNENRSTWGWGG